MKLIFDSLNEVKDFLKEMGYVPKTEVITKTKTVEPIVKTVPENPRTTETTEYATVVELAEKYEVCPQAIDWHLKKANGLAFEWDLSHNPKRRLIKKADAEKYFAEHPLQNSGRKKGTTTKNKNKSAKIKVGFVKWKEEQYELIKSSGTHLSINQMCSKIFAKMRNIYGIVWEQSKRDFYKEKGRLPMSTMELCYYVQYEQKHNETEHYEHLFENELDTIISEERK